MVSSTRSLRQARAAGSGPGDRHLPGAPLRPGQAAFGESPQRKAHPCGAQQHGLLTLQHQCFDLPDRLLHQALGQVRLQGHDDAALATFQRLATLHPNYPEAHNNLGIALKDQGKLDEAIVEYREALRINPSFALVRYNLGEALRQQGDRTGAAREFRDFLRLPPSSPEWKEKIERARSILAELEKS